MSTEIWYYVNNGFLFRHEENDGYVAMRRGLEPVEILLCTVEEAKTLFPKELNKAFKDTYGIREQA